MNAHVKTKLRPARDRQRGRVYNWEDEVLGHVLPGKPATVAQLRKRASKALAHLGLSEPPTIRKHLAYAGTGERASAHFRTDDDGQNGRYSICVPLVVARSWPVLHEVAHVATWMLHGIQVEPHGPEFVRIAIDLYAEFCGSGPLWRLWLEESARRAGVRFTPPGGRP